jgi:cytochrome c oxidase subunit IV
MSERDEPVPHESGRPLVFALVALLVLTAISWAVSLVDLGAVSTPIALAIAGVKATVVALVFMEVRAASLPARVVAFVTVGFIALLCAGIVTDIALR